MWLASLFDPAAYTRAQPQSVPYRFTALILRSPNPGHLVEFRNAAEVAGGLPARPLAYDITLQLLTSWADGIAARIAKTPALVTELRVIPAPYRSRILIAFIGVYISLRRVAPKHDRCAAGRAFTS